jgi:filamentous hemagglutinin family protein
MKFKSDFSSRFRILKGGKISLMVSALLGSVTLSVASPTSGVVTSGTANISQSGNTTNINQSSNKATINWQNFSIKSNETVNFNQPNKNSITLNRVVGNEKSVIDGALNANGQVWILNSNGVLFNKTAKVNTAGIVATTKELSDADFNAGNYNFKGDSKASVINLGTIEVSNSAYVVMAANEVKNAGTIKAVKGKVYLSGADKYSLNLNGNSLVSLSVNKGVLDALVENSGTVIANGGEIYLSTNAVNELLKGVVNNTGIIEANSLDGLTGKVELFAHGGTTNVSGEIKAESGFVETSADKVKIADDFKVTANKWLIDPTDFTIAASGGDITGTTLSNNLASADIEIQSTNGASGTKGDINVNDTVSWDSNKKLTLNAQNNININKSITATTGKLALYYGQGAVNASNTSTYNVKAKVNLSAGENFSTKLGSDGTETAWTVVNDINTLQNISLNGKYVLGADVDASSTSTWNSGAGWNALGNNTTNFTGNFDGLGHTIDKLYINNSTDEFVGLFGYINGAIISNIGLMNVDITASYEAANIGALVGKNENSTINNSYAIGSVTANGTYSNVGGLVGWNHSTSTINNSYARGSVTSSVEGGTVGGLVGMNNNSTINNSYATGSVAGNGEYSEVGGLIGRGYFSTINNSYASGSVTVKNELDESYSGGLYGRNTSSDAPTNSWYDNEANTDSSMIDTSYGKTKAEILNAFSSLTTDWGTTGGGSSVSGYEVVLLPYLTGVTRDEDKSKDTLFESGMGVSGNAYKITNWTQLQNINNSNILTQNYYFQLLNNLDSSSSGYTNLASSTANGGAGWNPLGNNNTSFTGNFDGLGHSISDLYINRSSTDYIGLFGYTNGATISNLGLVDVNIKSGSGVGGLVGYNYSSTIKNSYATGTVSGTNVVGGLVGMNIDSTITNSYATGTVNGTDSVGGLVGINGAASRIENSYASGTVSGVDLVGGLVGLNYSNIENSYYDNETNTDSSMGDISYGKTKAEILALVGGTWDDTIWSKTSAGSSVEGYEILELPYLIGVTRDEDKSVVVLFNSGLGTSANPYTIKNWTQLQNINNSNILTQNYYFQLLNNLSNTTSGYTNLASLTANGGAGWNSLGNGSAQFKGTFDGLGHSISDLYINRSSTDYIGLFGYTNGATISNLGLIDFNIVGGYFVGGLVGYNFGSTISNSYATGAVSGTSIVGGLVGYNFGSTISNSYATGTVSGYEFVGGLVGYNNDSTIQNSYATGAVSGSNYVGGLVGSGVTSTVTNSFWDTQTSGQNTSVGGTGLTTAQMSYGQIFKNASWDIVADSSVTSSTPVLKYDSVNSKYYWAIAPLSLSYNLGTKTSQYNGTTQNLSSFYTTATSIFGNDYSFLDGTYKFQVNEIDVTGYKNAATYENIKVASTNDFLNIASSGNTDGSLTITPKAITVNADDLNKIYGENNPTLTFTTDGLVGSDGLNGNLSTTATVSSNVGTYDITQGDLSNGNYVITFNKGELTVLAKNTPTPNPEPTPTPPDLSKIIDNIDKTIRVNVPNRGVIPPVASTTNPTQTNNGQEVNNIGSVNPDEGGIIVDRNSNVRIINGGIKLPIGLTQISDATQDMQIGETN